MLCQQQLLVSNKTVADSGWFDIGAFGAPMSLIVRGIVATDVVKVFVSNANNPDQDNDAGIQYGADITAAGATKLPITEPYRWIKVSRTAIAGAGVVFASLFSQRGGV